MVPLPVRMCQNPLNVYKTTESSLVEISHNYCTSRKNDYTYSDRICMAVLKHVFPWPNLWPEFLCNWLLACKQVSFQIEDLLPINLKEKEMHTLHHLPLRLISKYVICWHSMKSWTWWHLNEIKKNCADWTAKLFSIIHKQEMKVVIISLKFYPNG